MTTSRRRTRRWSRVRPAPTPAGYVRQSTVSFDFAGVPNDATDTGQIAFECQLYNTVAPPTAWQSCAERTVLPRPGRHHGDAVHVPGARGRRRGRRGASARGISLCAEGPDYDPSPATTTVRVDTTVPNTFVTRTPRDDIRPDWPVTLTRSPQVVLNSNEGGAGFVCTVNDKPRACAEGP